MSFLGLLSIAYEQSFQLVWLAILKIHSLKMGKMIKDHHTPVSKFLSLTSLLLPNKPKQFSAMRTPS